MPGLRPVQRVQPGQPAGAGAVGAGVLPGAGVPRPLGVPGQPPGRAHRQPRAAHDASPPGLCPAGCGGPPPAHQPGRAAAHAHSLNVPRLFPAASVCFLCAASAFHTPNPPGCAVGSGAPGQFLKKRKKSLDKIPPPWYYNTRIPQAVRETTVERCPSGLRSRS